MKIKSIVCPKCQQHIKLKLEHDSDLMIMACKSCGSFMMYYMGDTFEVDDIEMKDMASIKMKEVTYAIQADSFEESAEIPKHRKQSLHIAGTPVRKTPFSQSDISDLKIELESARDCLDFINSI